MAHKVRWSPRATSNLEEICDYVAGDSDYYARLFVKRIIAIVKDIKDIPQFPGTDWKGAIGFRDIIAHHYFDIDAR